MRARKKKGGTSPRTLRAVGAALMADRSRDLRGEATIDGVRPRKGMWLVHHGRQRCYGRVLRLRKTGDVVVTGAFGQQMAHGGAMLFEGGYSYEVERPTGPGWLFHVDLRWVAEPPDGWGEIA